MNRPALKGVNLGGWLVLEKWITPSLFAGTTAIDEYSYCRQHGAGPAQRLTEFRDDFITRKDFVWLRDHGVTVVRLPVGYWVFGGAPPYAATIQYVDKAFAWAKQTGIKVLLDLHAAPGSQNGLQHSGKAGVVDWGQTKNITATLQVIDRLSERFGNHPALLGISLLNEPSPQLPKPTLLNYYQEAYAVIRKNCGPEVWVVYSDCYAPTKWFCELPANEFKNIYLDVHYYQTMSWLDQWLPTRVKIWRAHWWLPIRLWRYRRQHPVVIGEWSLAMSSRSRKPLSAKQVTDYRRAQLKSFRSTSAHFFWTYKTEEGGVWSFRNNLRRN